MSMKMREPFPAHPLADHQTLDKIGDGFQCQLRPRPAQLQDIEEAAEKRNGLSYQARDQCGKRAADSLWLDVVGPGRFVTLLGRELNHGPVWRANRGRAQHECL